METGNYIDDNGNAYEWRHDTDGELTIWEWTGNPRDNFDDFFTIFCRVVKKSLVSEIVATECEYAGSVPLAI